MKQCTKCNISKPIEEFHKHKERKDGHFAHCKECHKLQSREWSLKNKKRLSEYQKKWTIENRSLMKGYQETYRKKVGKDVLKERRSKWNKRETQIVMDTLIPIQNDLCAICKKPFKSRRYIDHNHTTREIRGLLCQFCNVGISYFENVTGFAEKANLYLKQYPAKNTNLRKYWNK